MRRMVKNEQQRIALRQTRFDNPRLARLGIETMSLAYLLDRHSAATLRIPEQVDFYMLMLVTRGAGRHSVDFVDLPLRSRSLVLVRPGQVQRWNIKSSYRAEILLVDPRAIQPTRTLALTGAAPLEWPSHVLLGREEFARTHANLRELHQEIRGHDGAGVTEAAIRHLTCALLLRLERRVARPVTTGTDAAAARRTYRAFLLLVENRFSSTRNVRDYARRVGCSPTTLRRACLVSAHCTPKDILRRRVALEAQRLLAYGDDSIATIAGRLGFSEATNFVKFFVRTIGSTPSGFRSGWAPARETHSPFGRRSSPKSSPN